MWWPTAKKKGAVGVSSLSEEEREVIDLARVEMAMQAAFTSLKWEYTNTLVTRLTPGAIDICYSNVLTYPSVRLRYCSLLSIVQKMYTQSCHLG